MYSAIIAHKNYAVTPFELYVIVDNPTEHSLLFYLIALQGKNTTCHVSLATLCKYIKVTRPTLEKVIKTLKDKGYIDYNKGDVSGNANVYWVNIGVIFSDIRKKIDNVGLSDRATREYSESQKLAMARKTLSKPENINEVLKVNELHNLETYSRATGENLSFKD